MMKWVQLFTALFVWSLFVGCDGNPSDPELPVPSVEIQGALVKDLNTGMDIASITIVANDTAYSGAGVTINRTPLLELTTKKGTYYMNSPMISFHVGQSCTLQVVVNDSIVMTATATIPDTFHILPIADSLNPGGEQVPIQWTSSPDADGYIISLYGPPQAIAYADLAELGLTDFTIDRLAFRRTDQELVPGDYQVFVIAYNTTFTPYYGIALPLPSGLPADTVEGAQRAFGAGLIATPRTISVVEGR